MTEASTPLMRQYAAIKKQHPNALLFFRLGDFYELFFDDAITASRELQITLTSRNKEKDVAVPMCGVPYHAAEGYLSKLLRKGFRVAICEQMENPKLTKTIVRREVTRVLTPGTAADASLASEENNFLAAIAEIGDRCGLAALDLSTGEFRATEFASHDRVRLQEELGHMRPREVLYPAALPLFAAAEADGSPVSRKMFTETPVEDWAFSPDYAIPLLESQFGVLSLEGFGLATRPAAATAAGAILHYVRSTQRGTLEHVDRIGFYDRQDCLVLDAVTVRNLELVEPLFSGTGAEVTLFRTLDATLTPMGKRLLRSWLLRPSIDLAEINARQDAVAVGLRETIGREELRRKLEGVLDLERLLSRVTLETANPRDLLALAASFSYLPDVKAGLGQLSAARLQQLDASVDPLDDLRQRIDATIVAEPPLSFSDGGVIRSGVDAELDELRDLSRNSKQYIAQIEERERQRTGINSLKIKFNSVFGYYLEVTKPNLHLVPTDFERKQTLVNAERFTTPELKQYEARVLEAEEKIVEIERRLFFELRTTIAAEARRIRQTSLALAETDVLLALAHIAAERGYTRPALDASGVMELVEARHPVVEQQVMTGSERFVPNDLLLDPDSELILLLTGPNMGGKSTYLRQTALIVIMAQMGSYVPARAARIGLVDRIFTRIGASDNLARGRSTFMVEMTETAAILNTATARSLVLLDEMGRGTATYDGLALAWATVEYLHSATRAKTLFATHYHELTALAEDLPLVKNYRVSIKETPAGIVFLRKVEPGAADKSYGIEVAKLAGLPAEVIRRAREVLRQHEQQNPRLDKPQRREAEDSVQLAIFTPLSQQIVDRLKEIDVNRLTPLEALTLLDQLKKQIE
ncbi:MAG: DNA mismatch repair protein MutS [Acidobacteria bacterium]|nr:DNA mismatch repair protein MutS [Acidobacteriota bacterium]MBV9438029.1 DNA mismatch repair protein MutS [Acidobacteriota bacterium]